MFSETANSLRYREFYQQCQKKQIVNALCVPPLVKHLQIESVQNKLQRIVFSTQSRLRQLTLVASAKFECGLFNLEKLAHLKQVSLGNLFAGNLQLPKCVKNIIVEVESTDHEPRNYFSIKEWKRLFGDECHSFASLELKYSALLGRLEYERKIPVKGVTLSEVV